MNDVEVIVLARKAYRIPAALCCACGTAAQGAGAKTLLVGGTHVARTGVKLPKCAFPLCDRCGAAYEAFETFVMRGALVGFIAGLIVFGLELSAAGISVFTLGGLLLGLRDLFFGIVSGAALGWGLGFLVGLGRPKVAHGRRVGRAVRVYFVGHTYGAEGPGYYFGFIFRNHDYGAAFRQLNGPNQRPAGR